VAVQGCPEVTPLPCGVPRCAVDTAAGSSVGCEPSAPVTSGNTTQLLFANGGFELWARRSGAYGLVRNSAIAKNPPATLGDVTYQEYPPFQIGANPSEPRFWDLCMYEASTFERMFLDYNASRDGVRIGHLLHKVGALSHCDPVLPRGQGITLTQHTLGRRVRHSTSAAARIEFVKKDMTASLKSEHGAVASLVGGCRLTVSTPVLKAPTVSALENIIR